MYNEIHEHFFILFSSSSSSFLMITTIGSLLPAASETGGKKSSGSATLGSIKILRVFRVLRPLRAINRAKGLKVIAFVYQFVVVVIIQLKNSKQTLKPERIRTNEKFYQN